MLKNHSIKFIALQLHAKKSDQSEKSEKSEKREPNKWPAQQQGRQDRQIPSMEKGGNLKIPYP